MGTLKDRAKASEYNRRWRAKHREQLLIKEQAWRDARKEELRLKSKLWREAHLAKSLDNSRRQYHAKRDENVAKKRAYNAARREEIRAKNKEYRLNHPDKNAARTQRYRDANRERLRAKNREYSKANKAAVSARAMKRHAAKRQAVPAWADLVAIQSFYDEAVRLTTETGVKHHVDHIYPLRGRTVCGLHVAENLRVITETENCRKSNKHPDAWVFTTSPATLYRGDDAAESSAQ